MRTVTFADETYEFTDIRVHEQTPDGKYTLRINEGPHEGVCFVLSDMKFDDQDETLLHYDVQVTGAAVDDIKPIVDNFIIECLYNAIEKKQNEDQTVE